jgi:hypothetical protein
MRLAKSTKLWILGVAVLLVFVAYRFFMQWQNTIPTNSQIIVSLERTTCFGTCPSYKLIIYENGLVVYEGIDFVGTKGIRKANIGQNDIQQLASKLENSNFFSFQDSYDEYMATDAPSAITYVKIGNKEKRISHYYGDFNAPIELYELEENIDEIANSRRWIEACSFSYPYFCKSDPFFWIASTLPVALAAWISWPFIKKRKVFVGIIRGQAVIAFLWLTLSIITRIIGDYYSFGAVELYSIIGVSEILAFVIVALFMARLHSRQIKINL